MVANAKLENGIASYLFETTSMGSLHTDLSVSRQLWEDPEVALNLEMNSGLRVVLIVRGPGRAFFH